jgi:chromosome segregation ATPase
MDQTNEVEDYHQDIARLEAKKRAEQAAIDALCQEEQALEHDLETLQGRIRDLDQQLIQHDEHQAQLQQEMHQKHSAYVSESRQLDKVIGQRRAARERHLREFAPQQTENERLKKQLETLQQEVMQLESERSRQGLPPISWDE